MPSRNRTLLTIAAILAAAASCPAILHASPISQQVVVRQKADDDDDLKYQWEDAGHSKEERLQIAGASVLLACAGVSSAIKVKRVKRRHS